ncbi:MAG: NFACT RNA binding domain-containing protein [Desulfonatronovibrionaceae bacterium]
MEANLFRFAVCELHAQVEGLRVQKIYAPASDLWTLDLGRAGYLIIKASRKGGLFFLSGSKPVNPDSPPVRVMKLRKQVGSRRIQTVLSAWQYRRAAFKLCGPGPGFLILDLREGLLMTEEPGAEFEAEVPWPKFESVLSHPDIWREYPQLSPPLRHELAVRSGEGAQALYALLSSGRPEAFCAAGRQEPEAVYAWRPAEAGWVREFSSALEAVKCLGARDSRIWSGRSVADQPEQKRRTKRLRRTLKRLEEEHFRLLRMKEEGELAGLIQDNLYRLNKGDKKGSVRIPDSQGREIEIKLDPALTVLENMQGMFKRGRKGNRGLAFVTQRRKEVQKMLDEPGGSRSGSRPTAGQGKAAPESRLPNRYRDLAVHVFKTEDGFLLLRGKNSRANHELLSRAASPFDLWFHIQGGPGAHLILKRDHPEQEVPEQSMHQAACLAALASYRKNDAQAEVICCEVRDVRKVKGAPQGEVVVDKVRETVVTEISSDLEKRLKMA